MSSLPTYATPFVGRDDGLQQLRTCLQSEDGATFIVGPPGIGKTRLAVEAAQQHRDATHCDVWFCDLTRCRTLYDVFEAVTRGLDNLLTTHHMIDPLEEIGAWLATQQRALLILDNAEHVHAHVLHCVTTWRTHARGVAFVITSREHGPTSAINALDLSVLPQTHAVQLFIACARQAHPHALENVDDMVVSIVEQLECIPLAIELCAARLEVLSLTQLLERLQNRFALLRTPLGLDSRHATMWKAIDDSYQMLDATSRAVLRAMSLFEGGFTTEAVEAVCPCGDGDQDMAHTLALLSQRSLIQSTPERHVMLEIIREFGLAQLAMHEEQDDAWARCIAYVEALRHQHERHVYTRSTDAMTILDAEFDNMRACVRRLLTQPSETSTQKHALGLTRCLCHLSHHRTQLATFELMNEVLAWADAHGVVSGEHAKLLSWQAKRLGLLHKNDEAIQTLETAIAMCLAPGELNLKGILLGNLSEAYHRKHDAARSLEAALKAVDILREADDLEQLSIMLSFAAGRYADRGDDALAHVFLDESLQLARRLGNWYSEGQALELSAALHLQYQRLESARRDFSDALTIYQQNHQTRKQIVIRGLLGLLDHHAGHLRAARCAYAAVIQDFNEIEDVGWGAYFAFYLGVLEMECARFEAARARLDHAVSVLTALSDARFLALSHAARYILDTWLHQTHDAVHHREHCAQHMQHVVEPSFHVLADVCEAVDAIAQIERDIENAPSNTFQHARSLYQTLSNTPSDDIRLLTRLIRFKLDPLAHDEPWIIHHNGRGFRRPGDHVTSLEAKPTLARVVEILLHHRLEVPHDYLSRAQLISAMESEGDGPDARNRVYVRLSVLRKLGLESILQSGPDGYRFDPQQPLRVVIVPATAEPTT